MLSELLFYWWQSLSSVKYVILVYVGMLSSPGSRSLAYLNLSPVVLPPHKLPDRPKDAGAAPSFAWMVARAYCCHNTNSCTRRGVAVVMHIQ